MGARIGATCKLKKYTLIFLIFLTTALNLSVGKASQKKPVLDDNKSVSVKMEIPQGKTLLAAAQGSWKVFYLPETWVYRHLNTVDVHNAYVSLAPAHKNDVAHMAGQCPPPQRIVLGVIGNDQKIREHTYSCLNVCGVSPAGTMYKDLWAA